MTEPTFELRRRGPFGLVLQAERIALSPIRTVGGRRFAHDALPIILGPSSWVSFDLELERWRIRRPDGSVRSTASAVVATLEVARLLERTAADEVVDGWLNVVRASQAQEVSGG